MDRSRASRSARWGEACAPCAAAKTRCIRNRNPRGATCDRCQSLEKNCSDQVHRPRKKRQAKPSKAAQLEERLDDLMKSLKASGEGDGPSSPDILPSSYPSSSTTTEQRVVGSDSSAPLTCTCKAPVSKTDLIPLESDEALLSIYMNHLSSQFPFVIIPSGTTPGQLQATRPFLMKTIRMVASVRHLRSMRGQSRAVIRHIADAMLMRSERSLDLLQGILVFLGFYHYFCMSHAHFNNLTHLAVSLVGDMDLSTCPGLKSREGHHRPSLMRPEGPRTRTNEERRTLLGVWYMSSNAALVVEQLGPANYTKYLDQCLQELQNAEEFETDQLVAQLVRIQHLTEKIFHFHTRDQLVDELPGIPKASAAVYLEAFHAELDRLRNTLPPSLKSHNLLTCHYNSAYLRLFSPLLADAHLVDIVPQTLITLTLSGLSPLDILSSFTAALKTWFKDWLAVPVCSYFYLPQPASSQLIYASRNLIQWASLAGPSAVPLSCAGAATATASSLGEVSIPRPPLPAFIGVPPCPELSVPVHPVSGSAASISAQTTLDILRAEIFARPELRLHLSDIADAMAVRFEAAEKEMAAAQGGVWRNDTWRSAAEQMKTKKARVEEWCQMAAVAGTGQESQPLVLSHGGEEATNVLAGWSMDDFESHDGHEVWRWASDIFDGMDLDAGASLDASNDWGVME